MSSDDLPVISLPTDSTKLEVTRQPPKPAVPAAPLPPRRPMTEVRRPGEPPRPTAPVPLVEVRPATTRVQPAPPPPRVAAPPPPPAAREDEDPEKLLRQYADHQKSKVAKLEVELVELRKSAAERDQFRSKSETLAKELQDARGKLEAASKVDAVVKDLQGKLDAAILSNGMLTEEGGKLKAKAQELAAAVRKLEERAGQAEKGLADASRQAAAEKEARREAEARIAAAAQALQARPPAAALPRK